MLNTLRRIVQAINAAHNFGEALQVLVKRVREAINTEACSIFLYDHRTNQYILVATEGLNPSQVGQLRLNHNEGVVGLVGSRAEPVNLENAPAHPHYSFHPEVGEEKFVAFLGAPIIHHRQLLGVIIAQQEEARRFDETEETFLVTIAAQIAGVMAHAEATGELSRLLHISSPHERQDFMIYGIASVPGVGIGQAVIVYPPADLDSVPDRAAQDIEQEIELFIHALAATRADIETIGMRLSPIIPESDRVLFDVYLRILDSDSLRDEVIEQIQTGVWAQAALKKVIKNHLGQFEVMDDAYLKERASDLRDLGRRILAQLQAKQAPERHYPERTILIGEEITPADLAQVPEEKLLAIVSASGSINSHVAILARAMAVPTVMGVKSLPADLVDDSLLIVDGYYGQVFITPSAKLLREYEDLAEQEQQLDNSLDALRKEPSETLDGHALPLLINTGLPSESSISLSMYAEGVGLYRTEVPFMTRESFPSEEEQRILYRQLLKAYAPRPVIMRTLDIGGDKSLPYFPIEEPNPFLGWRGIRVTLDHPEVFLVQAKAMMLANKDLNNLRIMLPMITAVSEVDDALRLLNKAYQEALEMDNSLAMPPIGVMIEVPSAVYQSYAIAQRVDFISIGSNDLTQYLLAVDRNNPRVANLYDSLHPAVLNALIQTVDNTHRAGKKVSICGEMSSDPLCTVLLLAMGFDALSLNASHLLRIKWIIRSFTHDEAKQILQEVLNLNHPMLIRHHMQQALEEHGLGGLIRAGN